MVRMTPEGEQLEAVRFGNDADIRAAQIGKAGPTAEAVPEATHGWYWEVDLLQASGASVDLVLPLGVKGFA